MFLTSKRKYMDIYKNFLGKYRILLRKTVSEGFQNRSGETRFRISQNIF